jgi:hypothetical protein
LCNWCGLTRCRLSAGGRGEPDGSGWDVPVATYFSGGVQTVGTGVANLLVDSSATVNTTDNYAMTAPEAAVFNKASGNAGNPADSGEDVGWNFHDTCFVTLKASKLASFGWPRPTSLRRPR